MTLNQWLYLILSLSQGAACALAIQVHVVAHRRTPAVARKHLPLLMFILAANLIVLVFRSALLWRHP